MAMDDSREGEAAWNTLLQELSPSVPIPSPYRDEPVANIPILRGPVEILHGSDGELLGTVSVPDVNSRLKEELEDEILLLRTESNRLRESLR